MMHKRSGPHKSLYEMSLPKSHRGPVRPEVKKYFKTISPKLLESFRMYHAFSWFIDSRRFKYKHTIIGAAHPNCHQVEISLYDQDDYEHDKAWELMGLADYTVNPWPFFTICATAKTQQDAKWKIFRMYIRFNQMKDMPCYIPEVLLGVRDNEIYDTLFGSRN